MITAKASIHQNHGVVGDRSLPETTKQNPVRLDNLEEQVVQTRCRCF